MRITDPVRWRSNVSIDKISRYFPVARTLAGKLRSSLGPLRFGRLRKVLPDGTAVDIIYHFGQYTIAIVPIIEDDMSVIFRLADFVGTFLDGGAYSKANSGGTPDKRHIDRGEPEFLYTTELPPKVTESLPEDDTPANVTTWAGFLEDIRPTLSWSGHISRYDDKAGFASDYLWSNRLVLTRCPFNIGGAALVNGADGNLYIVVVEAFNFVYYDGRWPYVAYKLYGQYGESAATASNGWTTSSLEGTPPTFALDGLSTFRHPFYFNQTGNRAVTVAAGGPFYHPLKYTLHALIYLDIDPVGASHSFIQEDLPDYNGHTETQTVGWNHKGGSSGNFVRPESDPPVVLGENPYGAGVNTGLGSIAYAVTQIGVSFGGGQLPDWAIGGKTYAEEKAEEDAIFTAMYAQALIDYPAAYYTVTDSGWVAGPTATHTPATSANYTNGSPDYVIETELRELYYVENTTMASARLRCSVLGLLPHLEVTYQPPVQSVGASDAPTISGESGYSSRSTQTYNDNGGFVLGADWSENAVALLIKKIEGGTVNATLQDHHTDRISITMQEGDLFPRLAQTLVSTVTVDNTNDESVRLFVKRGTTEYPILDLQLANSVGNMTQLISNPDSSYSVSGDTETRFQNALFYVDLRQGSYFYIVQRRALAYSANVYVSPIYIPADYENSLIAGNAYTGKSENFDEDGIMTDPSVLQILFPPGILVYPAVPTGGGTTLQFIEHDELLDWPDSSDQRDGLTEHTGRVASNYQGHMAFSLFLENWRMDESYDFTEHIWLDQMILSNGRSTDLFDFPLLSSFTKPNVYRLSNLVDLGVI